VIGAPMSNGFVDSTAAGNTTWYYRVQAANASIVTAPGDVVSATVQRTVFSDDPLAAGTTVIRTVHIMELREAINTMRARGALAPFPFTDPSLTGLPLKSIHITELRAALNAARTALGLPALTYTDASLMMIKEIHLSELRRGVR
jgi:hypothetical protein